MISIKNKLLMAALLGCSSLIIPMVAHASTIPAKTSWAVSRVASASQGSYCTMAQKYADDTVLTFGLNARGEYSLALDFKNEKFKGSDQQNVTLRSQNGSAQTYSVIPQNERTAVVGIGKNSSIVKQITSTENLSIKVGDATMDFALSDFAKGQKEIDGCIAGLQASPDKTADMIDSPVVGASSSGPIVHKNVAVIRQDKNELTAENLLEAIPSPSEEIKVAQIQAPPVAVVSPPPVSIPVVKPSPVVAATDNRLEELRTENARLTRAIVEQRQAFENQKSKTDGAVVDELQQKLDLTKVENLKLKDALAKTSQPQDDLRKLKNEVVDLTTQIKTLQTENASLKNQLDIASKVQQQDNSKQLKADIATLIEKTKSLQTENESLKTAMAEKDGLKQNVQITSQALDTLKAENTTLKNQNSLLSQQLADSQAGSEAENVDVSKFNQTIESLKAENATLKNKIALASKVTSDKTDHSVLSKENESLKVQIADLKASLSKKTEPIPAPDAVADDEAIKLRTEIRQLTAQVGVLTAEKTAAQDQIATLQKDTEGNQLKMAGGSWDLEQATRRYQESQREIQRLGALLQAKDVQCSNEKKEIEYMLFDPAIAEKAQIAMLNSLEDQIKEKTEKIASLEKVKADLNSKEIRDRESKIAELQKSMDQIKQSTASNESVVATLKSDLSQKTQQLNDAQARLQQLAQAQQAVATEKDTNLNALKAQVSQLQNQLNAEKLKGQQIDASMKSQQAAEQAVTLAALQTQIKQSNDKVTALQNQIVGMKSASVQAASVAPAAAASYVDNIAETSFKSADEFSGILQSAGISVRGNVQPVQGGNPSTYRAYSWKTDSLFGSVEMRKVASSSQFKSVIDGYLSRAKSRCQGEFAAVPSTGSATSKAYEIACVGQGTSSSASVLFTYGDNIVMTIAHEGRAEAMDLAIDARDKIASQLN